MDKEYWYRFFTFDIDNIVADSKLNIGIKIEIRDMSWIIAKL